MYIYIYIYDSIIPYDTSLLSIAHIFSNINGVNDCECDDDDMSHY